MAKKDKLVSYLCLHGISVDLAHVLAGVASLNTRDVQLPCVVTIVGDRESGIVRHHVVVNAQDGLCVSFYPRHLQHEIGPRTLIFMHTLEFFKETKRDN